jgi:hypothetical protein
MDIFEPNLSSAAVILKRDMTSRGVQITHKEALEIAAHMRGYQNHAAYAAHEKQRAESEPPVLRHELQDGVGSDYQYVGDTPGGIWIRVRNIDVHVICRQDGVEVELLTAGMADESTARTTSLAYEDAAEEFMQQASFIDMTPEAIRLMTEEGLELKEAASGRFTVTGKKLKGLSVSTYASVQETALAAYAHLFTPEPVLTLDSVDRYEAVGPALSPDQVLLTLRTEDFRGTGNRTYPEDERFLVPPYTYAYVSKTKLQPGAYEVVFAGRCSQVMSIADLQDPTRFRVVKELHSGIHVKGHF